MVANVLQKRSLVKKKFSSKEEFKAFCKTLTTDERHHILSSSKEGGLQWKEHELFKVDWMRFVMAVNKHLKEGGTFDVILDSSLTDNKKPKKQVNKNPKKQVNNLKSFVDELGYNYQELDGNIIIGNGSPTVKNKFGYPEAEQGTIKFLAIDKKGWNDGHYVLLQINFFDKDIVNRQLKGRFSGETKSWYIPFNQVMKAIKMFANVEISKVVADVFKTVFDNVKVDDIDVEKLKYKKEMEDYKYKKPDGMIDEFELKEYQETGVEFLIKNKRAILGYAVGLGKTPITITTAKELLNRGAIERALIIVPSSVKYNWKSEISKFTGETACVVNSDDLRNKNTDEIWKEAENSKFVIVNYAMILKHPICKKLKSLCSNFVITDESHKLKNYKAKTTQNFIKYWGNAQYKYFLTATPFPNGKPSETYQMLKHVDSESVGSWKEFGDEFVEFEQIMTRDGIIKSPVSFRNEGQLKERMKNSVIIRTHQSPDVKSSLPKDRHFAFRLEMTKVQQRMYRSLVKIAKMQVEEAKGTGINPEILGTLKKMEMVAIDPDLLLDDKDNINLSNLSVKEEWAVDRIVEHLEDENNRGMVVFCDLLLPLHKVRQGLIDRKVSDNKIAYISGDVENEERFKVTEKFEKGEVKVVLCTNAAEEGINLQKGAHTMIHLDIPWVPKSITQREGRILRNGQPNEYTVFLSPVIEGTIEERKREAVRSKVETIETLLGEGASGSSSNNVKLTNGQKGNLSLDDIIKMLDMERN